MEKKERRFVKVIDSLSELYSIENPKVGDYVVYIDNDSHKGYGYVYIEGESWMQVKGVECMGTTNGAPTA